MRRMPVTGTWGRSLAAAAALSVCVLGGARFATAETCGDGVQEGIETCDDGATIPGDGCDDNCQVEAGWTCSGSPSTCTAICGDGLVVGGETCDDAATSPGDGCDDNCQIEAGWTCSGSPSTCSAICGDGLVVGGETCDDGGTTAGNGCGATCQVECRCTCIGEPSLCTCPTSVAIAPTKLIVLDRGIAGAKVVFVANDPAIDKGSGTDLTTIGVIFDFAYDNGADAPTAGQFVAPEGSANWIVNKAAVAKYVNNLAPSDGGGARVTTIKPANLLKIVGRNLGDTASMNIFSQGSAARGTAHTSFGVLDSATGFDTNFCSTFTGCAWRSIGGGTGAKLICFGKRGGAGDPTCEAACS